MITSRLRRPPPHPPRDEGLAPTSSALAFQDPADPGINVGYGGRVYMMGTQGSLFIFSVAPCSGGVYIPAVDRRVDMPEFNRIALAVGVIERVAGRPGLA